MPALPSTEGQQWHYFQKSWHEGDALCLTQHFDQDTAYVTARIPFTPEYNFAFMQSIGGNSHARVVTIGTSKRGAPLQLIQIPAKDSLDQLRTKPCVLIYAREHPDEQDCSWVAQGAVQFLISDDSRAELIRKQLSFLVIPLLDPDGAAAATHENIISTFTSGRETPESLAYSAFFRSWVDQNKRLDLILALHNPAPVAGFHIACPMMEPSNECFQECLDFHQVLRRDLLAAGYLVRQTPWNRGLLSGRLSSFLSVNYGALIMPYEINSLSPKQQLNLAQLRQIGRVMCVSTAEYFNGKGKELLVNVDNLRRQWRQESAQFVPADILAKGNAIEIETRRSQNVLFQQAVLPAKD
jgi:hypothetical protein